MSFPISDEIIRRKQEELRIQNLGAASIRDLVAMANALEKEIGTKFVRMEMGVPGLPSPQIGIETEIAKLREGVSAVYPNLDGLPELKAETARFAKLFLNVDVAPQACVPTVGSMMGGFASFLVANRTHKERSHGTLFIDPGFNLHKLQNRILEKPFESIDLYEYRGDKLAPKLEEMLSTGKFQTILYSNPNNPTWQCLTEQELRVIGEMANKYDIIVIEDMAYFGMDFRQDYSKPGVPPYQPTVAHYTDHYIITLASSKVFSYAGQRVGMMIMSDKLFAREYPSLQETFGRLRFGDAMISSALYALSAGVTHSAQWGLWALLKASNDGEYNFREEVMVYGRKAAAIKKMFLDNGFHIVYDKDGDDAIADGFYFTIAYKDLDSSELLEKMMRYGLIAITLKTTGSKRNEGLRICVSLVPEEQFPDLKQRLEMLHAES